MDSKNLWQELNEQGAHCPVNGAKPWPFIWGSSDMTDLRKACETIMSPSHVDIWLNYRGSPYWGQQCPMDFIREGDYDEVYLAIYKIGLGEI